MLTLCWRWACKIIAFHGFRLKRLGISIERSDKVLTNKLRFLKVSARKDPLSSDHCNCNCNYILFTKLPWPGDSEGTFRSSSQAATCPSVYHTRWRLHTVPLIAERQAGKLWIPIFIVFGLTRPGIEPVSTASVADALSTRPLIG